MSFNSSFYPSYDQLYSTVGLRQIHEEFLKYLNEVDGKLYQEYLDTLCKKKLSNNPQTLKLSPILEDFIVSIFSINEQVQNDYKSHSNFAIIATAKRLFVQRYALKNFTEVNHDWQKKYIFKDDFEFAIQCLNALEKKSPNLEDLAQYAAWATLSENGKKLHKESTLFQLPDTINSDFFLKNTKKNTNEFTAKNIHERTDFNLSDNGFSSSKSAAESYYCIICHPRNKDSCKIGLKNNHSKSGCPLDENISVMHALRRNGLNIAALAAIVVDNPMVAATGHRICNDCMQSCIFQKQDPVNTPGVETNILESVLKYDYGFEIYSLLTRWNPLNFAQPLPKEASNYKVLVAGLGPAGFSMAHYLARDGHNVVGIDGSKLEPILLEKILIKDITSLYESLENRAISGFGGVAEYGITIRWNKNYLTILRIILERNENIKLKGSIRFGSQINESNLSQLGFDDVVICTGAGKPKIAKPLDPQLPGVRFSSDFLMALQLTGAFRKDLLTNLQLLTPIVVIGGGLSAIDAATEAKAYFQIQRAKFLKLYDEITNEYGVENVQKWWTKKDLAAFENLKNNSIADVKIIYRKNITDSPSYKQNHLEIEHALKEGIIFEENVIPLRFAKDENGWVDGVWVIRDGREDFINAKSIILALGTEHSTSTHKFTYGDANPQYSGSVVKAIASAKNGYTEIAENLKSKSPNVIPIDFHSFESTVTSVNQLSNSIIEIGVQAGLAAKSFQPGQFFKLQNFEKYAPIINGFKMAMEPLALTPKSVDSTTGIITFIIVMIGASSMMAKLLKIGEKISLMGPTGSPTPIPKNKDVLLIGGGQFNLGLIHVAEALQKNYNNVTWIAGYTHKDDMFYQNEIEGNTEKTYFCITQPGNSSNYIQGTVIEGLKNIKDKRFDQIIISGPTLMQKAVKDYLNFKNIPIQCNMNIPMQCMMQGVCGQCMHITSDKIYNFCCQHQEIDMQQIDFEALENRSNNNGFFEKITRMWVQNNL